MGSTSAGTKLHLRVSRSRSRSLVSSASAGTMALLRVSCSLSGWLVHSALIGTKPQRSMSKLFPV